MTRKREDIQVIGCGPGQLDTHYCMGPHGILRLIEIVCALSHQNQLFQFLCLVVICLIVSVFGPGPFKGWSFLFARVSYSRGAVGIGYCTGQLSQNLEKRGTNTDKSNNNGDFWQRRIALRETSDMLQGSSSGRRCC